MVKIGLHGSNGKVSQEILKQVGNVSDISISYSYSRNANKSLEELFTSSDIVIDFSNHAATSSLLTGALHYNKPLVIGTTGLNKELFNKIKDASKHIPIFYSANMSPGVFALTQLLEITCKMLGPDYDINIIETHHKHKQDVPSGTALNFERSIKRVNPSKHVDMSSIREKEELGTHEIIFSNQLETISIKHQANSRELFALSAINIAKWLRHQPKGFYEMKDFTKI